MAVDRQQSSKPLDDLDQRLIQLLTDDVRLSTGEIAKQLGVSSPTVRRRIDRLVKDDVVSLGPVVDLYAAGYEYVMSVGVKVEDRSPADVAMDIAAISASLTVNVVLGHFDIEVIAAVKTHEEVGVLLLDTLPAVPGIASLAPSLALDVWKFQSNLAPLHQGSVALKKAKLDETDSSILECLKADVRMSNRKVAAQLSISESTVRTRLKRMQEEKQVRLTATSRFDQLKSLKVAYVGIHVQGNRAAEVCKALVILPEISFVTTTLGRHEIFCCVVLTELEPMTELLQHKISSIPGVKSTESSHCVQHIKNQIEFAVIL